jgi:G:T-mismatch repair DNA endonuclease (very short patch repair protein)
LSKFQERVLSLLKEIFPRTTIRSEVNVKKLFPEFSERSYHYDIVIPLLKTIVECHGEQHGTLTSFSGNAQTADFLRVTGNRRDRIKEEVATENGWCYTIVWWNALPKDDSAAKDKLRKLLLERITDGKVEPGQSTPHRRR